MKHVRRSLGVTQRVEAILRISSISSFLAAFLSVPAIGAGVIPSLKIQRAVYSVQDGSIPCEVTSKVASFCNGLSECRVPVSSSLCPMGDPAPDRSKILSATYQCGTNGLHRASIPEGQELFLTCKQ